MVTIDNIFAEDKPFLHILKLVQPFTVNSPNKTYNLFCTINMVKDGNIAEVGTYKGGVALMMKLLKPNSNIYIFDTFEGIPNASEHDYHKNGDFSCSIEDVQKNIGEDYNFIKGIFPRSADNSMKFNFIHLDIDVYDGMMESIPWCMEHLNVGGILIIDDYGFSSCPGVKKAIFELFKDKLPIFLPSGQALIIKS